MSELSQLYNLNIDILYRGMTLFQRVGTIRSGTGGRTSENMRLFPVMRAGNLPPVKQTTRLYTLYCTRALCKLLRVTEYTGNVNSPYVGQVF